MIALKLFILFLFSRAKNNSEAEAEYRTALQLRSSTRGFAWDASQVTLMKAIILVTLEIAQCALITREVKENQMTVKKANNHIQQFTAGLNLRGDETLRSGEDPDGVGGMEFKNYACLVPSSLDCFSVPIPDIPEVTWLPFRSEWLTGTECSAWQHHLSEPRARRRITSELLARQLPDRILWNFTWRGSGFFFPPISTWPILIS